MEKTVENICFMVCVTSIIWLSIFFLINWTNQAYNYSIVEEAIRAEACYTITETRDNAPRILSYCGDSR